MSEFDEWQEDKALSDSEFYGAKEAWDFQQAKIDELQARIAELEETICTHLDERFLKGNKDEK